MVQSAGNWTVRLPVQVIDRQTLTVCLEEAARAARAQGFAVQTPPSIQANYL